MRDFQILEAPTARVNDYEAILLKKQKKLKANNLRYIISHITLLSFLTYLKK